MSALTPVEGNLSRRRVIRLFALQGTVGLVSMILLTIFNLDQPARVVEVLGTANTVALIVTFFLVSCTLQFLKFELTDLVFVSFGISAFVAMYPILGGVISCWTSVAAAMITRYLGIRQIGPIKADLSDPQVEYLKVYGLFGTYGLPIALASVLYEMFGGEYPTLSATKENVIRLLVGGLAVILANNVVLSRTMKAYGYEVQERVRLLMYDSSIYLLTLPYAICVTLAYGEMGIAAVLSLCFTGIIGNFAARNLAAARTAVQRQVQRLASLSNIGKTISLEFTTDELLQTIYTECRKVVDASIFSIALYDERSNELSFELDIRDGVMLPKERIPLGQGLNSWVLMHHQPLLIGSVHDEKKLGIVSVDDGLQSESWLGVPMIARDRVVGVLSIQSYRKNAFKEDDLMLLTAVANQAAVALENANLYRDLEGLTYALEQRVHERTKELNEANLRLMAADRSKSQFLANMSHELRTPLNSIIGFSSVLLDTARDLLPGRMYKFLENIQTAGNHLLEVINDILDLSKIEAGKMELLPDRFDVRETVAAVVRVMRGLASDDRVRITTEVSEDVPLVVLDEGRLKQILFNLLSNAVKFSPEGGPVTIRVTRLEKEESPIFVDTVRIEVSDQGIGIGEEELRRIFDEFYQTEAGRRAPKGGTGLGLSLTRNFVELHHGTIEVTSEIGHGSTFTMYLPINYHEAAAQHAATGVSLPARLREQRPPTVH